MALSNDQGNQVMSMMEFLKLQHNKLKDKSLNQIQLDISQNTKMGVPLIDIEIDSLGKFAAMENAEYEFRHDRYLSCITKKIKFFNLESNGDENPI
jgi:hypothetical protein